MSQGGNASFPHPSFDSNLLRHLVSSAVSI